MSVPSQEDARERVAEGGGSYIWWSRRQSKMEKGRQTFPANSLLTRQDHRSVVREGVHISVMSMRRVGYVIEVLEELWDRGIDRDGGQLGGVL